MARTNTTTGLENRAGERIFSSPVALAFVSRVQKHRGVSEADARKLYLEYIRKTHPTSDRRPRAAA